MGDKYMTDKMLQALDLAVREVASPYTYCIGHRREDNLCLVYEDGKWRVIIYERGQDDVRHESAGLFDACLAFIKEAAGASRQEQVDDQFARYLFYHEGTDSDEDKSDVKEM